jgi:hypothetical protein
MHRVADAGSQPGHLRPRGSRPDPRLGHDARADAPRDRAGNDEQQHDHGKHPTPPFPGGRSIPRAQPTAKPQTRHSEFTRGGGQSRRLVAATAKVNCSNVWSAWSATASPTLYWLVTISAKRPSRRARPGRTAPAVLFALAGALYEHRGDAAARAARAVADNAGSGRPEPPSRGDYRRQPADAITTELAALALCLVAL